MKYRLIKEYPGSPKVGTIHQCDDLNYSQKELNYYKNFTEFWELEKKLEYKIIEYISSSKEAIITPDNPLLNNGKWNIHIIQRLSDNVFFHIKDLIAFPKENYILNSIEISNKEVVLMAKDSCNSLNRILLKNTNKVKEFLFTTEDNVDIYEGDTFYYTKKNYKENLIQNIAYKGESESMKNPDFFDFSSKQAYEEHKLLYEKRFSLNDIIKIKGTYTAMSAKELIRRITNLK